MCKSRRRGNTEREKIYSDKDGSGMYENRFTPRAQNALRLAQASAEELGHSYVGSEHLLLGLLREEAGAAHRCLAEQAVTGGAGSAPGPDPPGQAGH